MTLPLRRGPLAQLTQLRGLRHGFAPAVALALVPVAVLALFHVCAQAWAARAAVQSAAEALASRPDTIGARIGVSALDAKGRLLSRQIPPGTKYLVLFVVRAATYQRDVGYWEGVARLMPMPTRVWLVGYCDGLECNSAGRGLGRPLFALAAFGEETGLAAAHTADEAGRLLVVDGRGAIFATYAWRNHDRGATAAFLESLR